MNTLNWILIIAGVVVVSITLTLFFNNQKKVKKYRMHRSVSDQCNDSEIRRRMKTRKIIEQKIKDNAKEQEHLLKDFTYNLRGAVGGNNKTFFDVSKNFHISLFQELQKLFDLEDDEEVIYCRRKTKVFGSDDFFIMTKSGFAYAPSRNYKGFIPFDNVIELENLSDVYVLFYDMDGESIEIEISQVVYNSYDVDEFIKITNAFLKKYKSMTILCFEAACEAINEKVFDLAEELMAKVLPYNKFLGRWLKCRQKYSLALEGIDKQLNLQNALYELNDLEKLTKKYSYDYGYCELLKVKILLELEDGVDDSQIRSIINQISTDDYPEEIKDEALELRKYIQS